MSGTVSRIARSDDMPAVRELFAEVFSCEKFADWFFKRVARPESTLVCERGGELLSTLQFFPVELKDGGTANYIYGVATRAKRRGCGLASGLLRLVPEPHILICEDDGVFSFYERLGYSTLFYVSEQSGSGGGGRLMREDDLDAVLELYEREGGFVKRTREHLLLNLELCGESARVLERDGKIVAFAFGDTEALGDGAGELAKRCLRPGSDRRFGCAKGIDAKAPQYINLLFN